MRITKRDVIAVIQPGVNGLPARGSDRLLKRKIQPRGVAQGRELAHIAVRRFEPAEFPLVTRKNELRVWIHMVVISEIVIEIAALKRHGEAIARVNVDVELSHARLPTARNGSKVGVHDLF